MKNKIIILVLIFISSLTLILQEVNCQYILKRNVFANGSADVSNSSFTLKTTIGQSAIGIISNTNNTAKLGFRYNTIPNSPIIDSQTLILFQGWNMISTYISPTDLQIENILNPLGSDFLIVKDYIGNVYWPDWGIDDIGTWDIRQGYQIYMIVDRDLTITGIRNEPQNTPILYTPGWKIASYLRTSPLDPATAVNSLGTSLMIMKDYMGNVYWPDWGIDDIILMRPGQGYQMYLSDPATLIYPAN